MADQQLTAAMSAVAVNDPPSTPRPDSPLPRELRDQVYGYLLDNKYTRVKRTFKPISMQALSDRGSKADHFHTNILAVNRAINDEAEKLLHERNIFIVASYQCPLLSKQIRDQVYVPIVTERHVCRMRHHSLRIQFKVQGFTSCLAADGNFLNDKSPDRTDSAIFLVDHMEKFGNLLKMRFTTSPNQSVEIDALDGSSTPKIVKRPAPVSHDLKPPRLLLDLRETKFRTMDRSLQSQLLAPFSGAPSHSPKISFTGSIRDLQETIRIQKTIGSSLVCTDAMSWTLPELRAAIHDVAYDALQYDDEQLALALYLSTQQYLQELHGEHFRLNSLRSDYWRKLFCSSKVLQFQAFVSAGWIKLRMRMAEGFGGIITQYVEPYFKDDCELSQIERAGVLPFNLRKDKLEMVPFELQAHACLLLILADLYFDRPGVPPSRQTVGEAVNMLASYGDEFPHINHDRKILAHASRQTDVLTEAHRLSINAVLPC